MPGRTTLEVQMSTKDRVNRVKGPLTADQLINLALDHLPPEQVQAIFEAWQADALKALYAHPELRKRIHPPPRKTPSPKPPN